MKIDFLRESPAVKKLILIAAGWNTTPAFYAHIRPRDGWDMAVVWDFEDLSPLCIPDRYSTLYLYAWSFGVTAAEVVLPAGRLTEAFAIAGTPQGIGEFGIPSSIFSGTRDSLSLPNLIKFRRRMFATEERDVQLRLMELLPENPDIEQLRRQLDAIAECRREPRIRWRRAYITAQDRIIPATAQRAAWNNHSCRPDLIELPKGHYVDLQEIIESTIPDTAQTAAGFAESRGTYSDQATAQLYFAGKLMELIDNEGIKPGRILEIGNGAGTLSGMLADRWPEAEVTFVDLCKTEPYNRFAVEHYIQGDAETWLEEADGEWDLIVSGSAVQWFANPRVFFRNARRLLAKGGVMACSIFSAGNLRELDVARPSPIHYHSSEALAGMAGGFFGDLYWLESERHIRFESPRAALLHLRDTGVRSGLKVPLPRLLVALREPVLTYTATLIVGK